ncbi:unnamed protein product [Hymenolepis diminuta]|uniref:Tubulin-specific chaperone E n=1 Tax=Hymenolepis diminuta TaxID=6216 RepID=A0A0R3S9S8_HYMDI|nr:unnamed protein product [Hymenolepis diminuta]VUZ50501.1 unnamed protein product [Hymenolepis diminuta]
MFGASNGVSQVANIYDGTSTGKITNISQNLIGCRVVKEEQFGTIKYVGPLANSKFIWLGVDWDDSKNGRHDGSFKGITYFYTHHPTSGSFLKPEKVSLGTSLEEALVTHYVLCVECQMIAKNPALFQAGGDPLTGVKLESATAGYLKATMDLSVVESQYLENHTASANTPFTVEIFTNSSGDTHNHEKCGTKGVADKLSQLRSACVQDMPVFRGLKENETLEKDVRSLWPESAQGLTQYLSSLCELDISRCLFSKWVEIAYICRQLPALKKLNVGSNYLRLPRTAEDELSDIFEPRRRLILDIDSDVEKAEALCSSAFKSLTRLVTVQMPSEKDGLQFGWSEITRILSWMPSLQDLCAAYNELGNLPDPLSDLGNRLTPLLLKLFEIDLTATGLTDFSCVFAILGNSKNLKNLILNGNKFSELNLPVEKTIFPNLEILTLRENLINDWETVNELDRLPNLTNLILSQNPIIESVSPETARQEMIARLPKLKCLNRQDVERNERRGAELDFLKRYGKAWIESEKLGKETKVDFEKKYPTFKALCDKHGAPDQSETKTIIQALKEGLVELTISCDPPNGSNLEVVRRLPSRMTVNHLRALVRRLFHLSSTASICLVTIASRPGFGNVEVPLDLDTREIGFFGVVSGDRLVARWSSV